ncbi:MAG: AEC family transporter [Clostridiales bacterium]|nr:AEC family transporter [Clostridiales bacterium]
MEIFISVISQIGVLFSFIMIGFILCRTNLISEESSKIFSKLENMIFMPAVVINTFWSNCTVKNISEKWIFIIYSSALLAFCIAVGFIVSKFLGKTPYLKKIYRYSVSVSNFGFVGTAMVSGIYGGDSIELFDYLVFTLPLNMFTYSVGIAWLIPNNERGLSLKSFVNPIFISLFIGGILGLLSVPQIPIVSDVIKNAASCMSPIAMILTGFVIGGYNLRSLFRQWQTYAVAAIRLIALPSLFAVVLRMMNTPQEIVIAALCAHAMPLGLNTVIIPSAYGENPEAGASMALVSQLTAIFTIPVLFLIFANV